MKSCTTCKTLKDESFFFKKKNGSLYAKCKECKKKQLYNWREKNKEKWNAYVRERAQRPENKKARHEYSQRSEVRAAALKRSRDPKYREKIKQYLLNNPEKAKAFNLNRSKRRRILVKNNNISDKDLLWIKQNISEKCCFCGFPADTMDHIFPLSRGGTHTVDNLWPACRSCNSQKGNKTVLEYYDWLARHE